MGKCYCDYCDVFLTNDSVTVRKQHNEGNRHKHNVCEYYRHYIGQKLQEEIDDIVQLFEIRVSRGEIRPSYGLPPGVTKVGLLRNDNDDVEGGREGAEPDPKQGAMDDGSKIEPTAEQNTVPESAVAEVTTDGAKGDAQRDDGPSENGKRSLETSGDVQSTENAAKKPKSEPSEAQPE